MSDPDALAVRRAQHGDTAGFEELIRRHDRRTYNLALRVCGDPELARDAAQEAWLSAFRKLDAFRGDSAFTTWLHRIAVNSALHGRRARLRRTEREAPLPVAVPVSATGERTLLRLQLERALEQLPERMRQVLVLHDVEGYKHHEIADLLGISPGTSKAQLHRARMMLRKQLL